MASTEDDANDAILEGVVTRVPAGIIVPPKGIRALVEKTAGYVARNGKQFEARIRTQEQGARMSFLDEGDPYEPFYRWRYNDIVSGGGNAIAAGRANEVSFQGKEVRKGPEKPEDFSFSARMPNMSAEDYEVIKLTATFVAKNGRGWMTQLSQKEAGNPQFNFLRPQHTFHQFFSRLVEQYTDLLNGDSVNGGLPEKMRKVQLEDNVQNKQHIIERAKKRSEWVKYQEAQKVAKEEKDEKERVAYAQIDWHDFVVVETVVFDERDEQAELPPPPTLNDLQSASLEQKAARSIDPSRRLEEAFPTFEDQNQFYGQQPQYPPQPQQVPQPPQAAYPPQQQPRMAGIEADRERVRAAQEAARQVPPTVLGRTDNIPRAQLMKSAVATSICPNCKLPIPNNEMENHLRIELLDPRWREQSKIAQQRASTTNLSTADVANNLKRLASQRTDVFDPVTGRAMTGAESQAKRMPPPQGVDGTQGGMQHGQNTTDMQEQIRNLHQRFGGQQQGQP